MAISSSRIEKLLKLMIDDPNFVVPGHNLLPAEDLDMDSPKEHLALFLALQASINNTRCFYIAVSKARYPEHAIRKLRDAAILYHLYAMSDLPNRELGADADQRRFIASVLFEDRMKAMDVRYDGGVLVVGKAGSQYVVDMLDCLAELEAALACL